MYEPRLIDDDGSILETPSEMDRRHRDERLAAHAVAAGHAEWLEGRPAEGPCCPDDEPSPCAACVDPIHGRPDAPTGDGWDDDHVWNLGPDPERLTLAEFLDLQATHHRELDDPRRARAPSYPAMVERRAGDASWTTPRALACPIAGRRGWNPPDGPGRDDDGGADECTYRLRRRHPVW